MSDGVYENERDAMAVFDPSYCHLLTKATPSHRLNFLTVGIPSVHVPEEAIGTGGVVLPPNGVQRNLTFRIPNFMDLWVDRVMIDLFSISSGDPAAGTAQLAFIPPFNPSILGASVNAPVTVRFEDTGTDMVYQKQEMPWQFFASDGRTPHRLQAPFVWRGSRTYTVTVRNNHPSDTFVIMLTLVGRRRRVQESPQGWNSDDSKLLDWYLKREESLGNLSRGYLSGDHASNIRAVGQAKNLPLPEQPVAVAAGAFGTLGSASRSTSIVFGNRRYVYVARQWSGRMEDGNVSVTTLWNTGNTFPVFTRVFDNNAQYWITNGLVLFRHMYGDGELPSRFPVDWSWGKNAYLNYEFYNTRSQPTDVMVDTEGWYRAVDSIHADKW